MDLKRLADYFDEDDLEWRIGTSGIMSTGKVWARLLVYVTNRAIMTRLDDVCGPGNWSNEFQPWQGGQLCGISVRVPREHEADEWVTKWDGAGNTEFEAVKGGLSDSMKRAAVQWGIGRYLYQFGDMWATTSTNTEKKEWNFAYHRDKKTNKSTKYWWKTPKLSEVAPWAIPGNEAGLIVPTDMKPPTDEPESDPEAMSASFALTMDDAADYAALRAVLHEAAKATEDGMIKASHGAEILRDGLKKAAQLCTEEDLESFDNLAVYVASKGHMPVKEVSALKAVAIARFDQQPT